MDARPGFAGDATAKHRRGYQTIAAPCEIIREGKNGVAEKLIPAPF
jgi:hypothetical protein